MVVARYTLGQLRMVDRLRETVRLAEGLDGKGGLTPEVRQRALECLARFGQRIRDIPPQRVRALATNTVRALSRAAGVPGAGGNRARPRHRSRRPAARKRAWSTSASPMRNRRSPGSCGW